MGNRRETKKQIGVRNDRDIIGDIIERYRQRTDPRPSETIFARFECWPELFAVAILTLGQLINSHWRKYPTGFTIT